MIAGRRLHAAMLADAIGRGRRGTAFAVVLWMLAVAAVLFFAIVVTVWLVLRSQLGGAAAG
jgi:hypothetical protein